MSRIIRVRATPRAEKNKVQAMAEGLLRVRLTVPPEGGKANAALLKLLARYLKVRKSCLSIVKGQHSRDKHIFVQDE
ncbi:MAG: DUF167 domain-containing protein [Candidatus Omnitrophota bacterium]